MSGTRIDQGRIFQFFSTLHMLAHPQDLVQENTINHDPWLSKVMWERTLILQHRNYDRIVISQNYTIDKTIGQRPCVL